MALKVAFTSFFTMASAEQFMAARNEANKAASEAHILREFLSSNGQLNPCFDREEVGRLEMHFKTLNRIQEHFVDPHTGNFAHGRKMMATDLVALKDATMDIISIIKHKADPLEDAHTDDEITELVDFLHRAKLTILDQGPRAQKKMRLFMHEFFATGEENKKNAHNNFLNFESEDKRLERIEEELERKAELESAQLEALDKRKNAQKNVTSTRTGVTEDGQKRASDASKTGARAEAKSKTQSDENANMKGVKQDSSKETTTLAPFAKPSSGKTFFGVMGAFFAGFLPSPRSRRSFTEL